MKMKTDRQKKTEEEKLLVLAKSLKAAAPLFDSTPTAAVQFSSTAAFFAGISQFEYEDLVKQLEARGVVSMPYLTTWQNAEGDEEAGFVMGINTANMNDFIADTEAALAAVKNAAVHVHYNGETGIGFVGTKRFKFKNHQPEFSVFAEMYNNIGKRVPRKRTLALAHRDEYVEDQRKSVAIISRKKRSDKSIADSLDTYFINSLAKKIRERTGLNPNQIVNNNGDLTLMADKSEFPPK